MPPAVRQALAVAREKTFRLIGEGTGLAEDTDRFDLFYDHLIAIDSRAGAIVGAYRLGRIDQILPEQGLNGSYLNNFYDLRRLYGQIGPHSLELGRSFVDRDAGASAIVALDLLWRGLAHFISLHPQYSKLAGSVSISNAYSETSILLMLEYFKRHLDPGMALMAATKSPSTIQHPLAQTISSVAESIRTTAELNSAVRLIDQKSIPSLLISYAKLGARYVAFAADAQFNCVDSLIVVDLLSPGAASEGRKFFGDEAWASYLQAWGR
jgi:putative hemolysin